MEFLAWHAHRTPRYYLATAFLKAWKLCRGRPCIWLSSWSPRERTDGAQRLGPGICCCSFFHLLRLSFPDQSPEAHAPALFEDVMHFVLLTNYKEDVEIMREARVTTDRYHLEQEGEAINPSQLAKS